MLITVDIPEELVAELADRGLTPERYVDDFVHQPLSLAPFPRRTITPEELKASFARMNAKFRDVPNLPDEALTREGIYQDHD